MNGGKVKAVFVSLNVIHKMAENLKDFG